MCVSLSLAPKIRLAYKGTTAGEEAKGGGANSASNTADGTKNTSDGNTNGSVASNNKKMQQVAILCLVRAPSLYYGHRASNSRKREQTLT